MNYCSCCGIPIPKGQNICSMCMGDIDHGSDGYYREWAIQEIMSQEKEGEDDNEY